VIRLPYDRQVRPTVAPDAAAGTVTFTTPTRMSPGAIKLHLVYAGALRSDGRGCYLVQSGGRKYLLSQMESTDARHAFADKKAAAVTSMAEAWIGERAFWDALNGFLRDHAYGTATGEDLWTRLASSSGLPVDQVMRTFLTRPGVPLVAVESTCEADETVVDVSVRRFTLDGATGYYYSGYSPSALAYLATVARARLTPAERMRLLDDQWPLAEAEDASFVTRALAEALKGNDSEAWPNWLAAAIQNPAVHDEAWSFLESRWSEIQPKLDGASELSGVVSATGSFCDGETREDVRESFAGQMPLARTLDLALGRIDACRDMRLRQQPALAAWLSRQP
jgi:hypothetical protein